MPEGNSVQGGTGLKGHIAGHHQWTATGRAALRVLNTFGMSEVALLIVALVLQTCLAGDQDYV